MNAPSIRLSLEKTVLLYLVSFLFAYFAATILFQLRRDVSILDEGSPFDLMNGGLLWLASVMALLNAVLRSEDMRRSALWLLGAAAIGIVALDELFALHERSLELTGDDDHPKIVLLLCAGIGVFVLNKFEQLHPWALRLIVGGLVVHFVYLMVDMGDGDYFTLPFAPMTLQWAEECLELTGSALYFSGLFMQAVMTFHVFKCEPASGGGAS